MQSARQKPGRIDHVAIQVKDVQRAIDWYSTHFQSEILYQDDSWALLRFANIKHPLLIPEQNPTHVAES